MADSDIPQKMESALVSLLSSVQKEEDVQQMYEAGITEACFAGAPQYWQALQYICGRVRKGKKISKAYLKRKHEIVLIRGADAPKLYADEIVLATARSQADSIIAELDEANRDDAQANDFYESARKARNLLRDIACPASNGQQAMTGRSVTYAHHDSMVMPPPQKWIVRGIVPEKWATFLYGRGGSAKSGLAVLLATCVAAGKPFLGVPVSMGKVLYIDWEADEETFRATINRVAGPLGIDLTQGMPNIIYKRLYAPLNEYLDDIIEEVEDEGVVMVILDSFGFSMSGQDTTAQPDVTAQMARLAKIPAATVIIDHIGKQGKGEDGPFGSVYKHAAARWMWWLQAASKEKCPDGEIKPGIFVRMTNTKHNIAAQQDAIFLHMTWDDEFAATKMSVQKVAQEDVPESLAGDIKETDEPELSPGETDFLRYVKSIYIETHHAATQDDLIECMGVGVRQVRNTAEKLHGMGLIELIDVKVKRKPGEKARSPRAYLLAGEVQSIDTTDAETRV